MNQQKQDESLNGSVITVLKPLIRLLNMGHCDIWDLFVFLEVEEAVALCYYCYMQAFFYSAVISNCKLLELSEEEYHSLLLRQNLTTIWNEMVRIRKSRYCLQNVVTPVSTGSLSAALSFCISFVQNCSKDQRQSTLFDYTCLLLGFSSFYSLKWSDVWIFIHCKGQAIMYWNQSNWQQHHWYEQDISLLIKGNIP